MEKSPINELQEFAIAYNQTYPTYKILVLTHQPPQFECICNMNGQQSSAISSNKKLAKTLAADKMIKLLNIDPKTAHNRQSSPVMVYISLLNEHCQKNNLEHPNYSELKSENSLFVIQCEYNGLTARGMGRTKKLAKEQSAEILFALLPKQQTINDSYNNQLSETFKNKKINNINDNFVGFLKEYCDRNCCGRAEFIANGKVNNEFQCKCLHESLSVIGSGLSKNLAKQNSAKKMIELLGLKLEIKTENLDNDQNGVPNKTVVEVFKNLSVDNLTNGLILHDDANTHSANSIEDVQLRNRLNDFGAKVQFSTMQEYDPVILSLSLSYTKDGNVVTKTFIECGTTQKDAKIQLLKKAVQALKL